MPSRDACPVRRALAHGSGAGILRCVPLPHDRLVRLEVHLPLGQEAAVMQCVIGCVPCGQIGPVRTWDEHLTHHGLAHGH
ncbi:hypothetical protein [Rhodoferax koreensis]|uniref:hypothetical protein n=1 Tax=Rhodoferax koreensis TaxID=1842727 RepID=UPI0012FFB25A|nr:hypothetical protein [Rhodoferax koreense]